MRVALAQALFVNPDILLLDGRFGRGMRRMHARDTRDMRVRGWRWWVAFCFGQGSPANSVLHASLTRCHAHSLTSFLPL